MNKTINKIEDIIKDFRIGNDAMNELKGDSVTIFGSARLKEDSEDYKITMELSERLCRELNINVITGGGPGIMEAANKGAYKCDKTKSVGMGIVLPFEEAENEFTTINEQFKYFFSRKVMLINYSKAYIAMKGGFGTLDEIFETITLMQTKKIRRTKIYLIGTEYYGPLMDYIKNSMLPAGVISDSDLELFELTDDLDFVIEDIRKLK
jgi:hypothetical protein